jgi:uncharacterized protein (DUF736 family)
MADPGFEAFLWSITQQESGGNYGAVGPWVGNDRAYGRYQVMGANIPSWTRKYYGRSLTPQQYLSNRAAQDAVVRGVLGGYYKKYGARGAAAMWYSGQPNPNKTYGNPPVYRYVNSVVNRASKYSGQSLAGVGGASYNVQAVTPKLDKYTLMAQYGLTADMLKQNKDLRDLFNEAVKNGYDSTLFTAKLKNTPWWRHTSDSARKYFMMKVGDPATFKAKTSANMFAMNQLAVQVGLTSQISNGKPSSVLAKAIQYKMRDGWTDARIKAYFGSMVGMHGGGTGEMYGEAGEAYDQIFALAYANGQAYSRSWYQSQIRKVVSGKTTVEALSADIRSKAAAQYYAFANQIRAGQNAMDLAQPYIQSVAQILELPVTDIDLHNPFVNKAMTAKVAPGQKPGTQYPIWQFENDLRADPLWKKTNNARESMFSVARQVAKDFGFAY